MVTQERAPCALTNLSNDPPAVVTGLTVPKANATGVQTGVFPQVTFTEPVKHLPQHVVLQGGGSFVPILLSGDGPNGTVDPLTTDDQVVTSLTIQPLQPLRYNTTYTLTLTADIIDLDVGLNGQPAPKALAPYTTTFTTFAPAQIGQSAESYSSPAIVVLGDRGYLAVPLPNQAGLKIYDVSDPTALAEVLPSEPVVAVGAPYDLVGEETSPLTGGRVVALTTGPIGIPYRPSDVYLYDVATDQPQWIGAVTLGNSPSDGIARRTVMKDGVLYATTAGIGKGIQIVDLNLALSDFQTATANGTASLEYYYQMLAQLGLEGQGFGQDAISHTIFVDTGSDRHSNLWDLAVGDLTVDGLSTRMVAATGARALVLANPTTSEILYKGRVMNAVGLPVLVWGYSIGLTKIDTRDIAVLAGFNTGAPDVQIVTVDVTDPRHPFALGSLSIAHSEFDLRSRIVIKDGIAYVSGPTSTQLIDVSDPAQPRRAGVIQGFGGILALTSDPIVFGIGSPLVPGDQSGIKSAVTGRFVYLAPIKPTVVRSVDALTGSDRVETAAATSLKVLAFGVETPQGMPSVVDVRENGQFDAVCDPGQGRKCVSWPHSKAPASARLRARRRSPASSIRTTRRCACGAATAFSSRHFCKSHKKLRPPRRASRASIAI